MHQETDEHTNRREPSVFVIRLLMLVAISIAAQPLAMLVFLSWEVASFFACLAAAIVPVAYLLDKQWSPFLSAAVTCEGIILASTVITVVFIAPA